MVSNALSTMNDKTPSTLSYRDAGVDIDRGNALVERIKPLVAATKRPGVAGELGGFGGLFAIAECGLEDPVLVAATDGVGTKLRLAIDAGLHDTVGIDLVAMCVNDLVVQGAEPWFFLDYFATASLELEVANAVIAGIADGCRTAGAALLGGETAEMPDMYARGDYDLAGFAVGAVERSKLIDSSNVKADDVIIGLASSGVHSNGFSLVRRIVERVNNSDVTIEGQPLLEALLAPTRIYVKAVLSVLQAMPLKALAHITGGGLTENLPRVMPPDIGAEIDLDRWSLPPLFEWLAASGPVADDEMLRTFNCGIGMAVVVDAALEDAACAAFEKAGERAFPIGRAVAGSSMVQFRGSLR